MKVVTAKEMREIDRKTIVEYGIPGMVLMERAGLAVSRRIKELFGRRKIVVISGRGNNGGDGLVVARHLVNEGWDARVFLAAERQEMSADAQAQCRIAEAFGVPLRSIAELLSEHRTVLGPHVAVVDALFGTGLTKPLSGIEADVVKLINGCGLPILSIDIPSGISSDDGQVLGTAVKATCTVTFGLPKRGHLLHPGASCAGRLFIEDIGFPRGLLEAETLTVDWLERSAVARMVPRRDAYSHKGHYGHVLIVAGSKGKTGAARMAAAACMRSGAGLVTLGVPASLSDVFQSVVTEEMTLALPDTKEGALSSRASGVLLDFVRRNARTVAIGPGTGVTEYMKKILLDLVVKSPCPVVIDADGIRCLQGRADILRGASAPVVLTPHPGEMESLLRESGMTVFEIEKDRIKAALFCAKECGAHVVLKGVPTVIAHPDGRVFINATGNPGMASAGSGDVLTGMVAGLLAQTGDPLRACILGVYLHGLAGDVAASRKGHHSLIASDIIDAIPSAFLSLLSADRQ